MIKNYVSVFKWLKYKFAKIGTKITKIWVASVGTGLAGETDRSNQLSTTLSICLNPITNKSNPALSHSSLSLPTYTPSPSHSLTSSPSPWRALPLPQILHFKSSIPNRFQDQGSFISAWGTFFSMYSSLGCLRFLSSSCKKSSFKVLQLVPARSIFLGGSKWFSSVNHLYMLPSTRI